MHDIVIRGGTIIDGSGKPAFSGDVAIDGDRIASVGGKAGPGKREVKADGQLVTPGFVDIHTHYDGQATWDPHLAPSIWHGVTTLQFGNCGVGFAPVRPEHRNELIDLMEAVEDIPGITLTEGLKWDWESFPEYLDALDRLPRVIDIAAQMPHHSLRVYVMGDRALRREAATPDDIAEMNRLTVEALRAGAFGFTTSRTDSHKTLTGDMVPARYSEIDELLGIGRALGTVGRGAFGMNNDFEDEASELAWMTQLSQETGAPVWFLLTDRNKDPQRWRRLLAGVADARTKGARLCAQVAGRPVGVILGIQGSLNPFSIRESYKQLESTLPFPELMKELRKPETRARILADTPSKKLIDALPQFWQAVATRFEGIYVMGDTLDYEPPKENSLAAIAQREGRTPLEVAYDYLTSGDDRFLFFPVVNYVVGNHEPIREMLLNSASTLVGLSDAGAHCSAIIDASLPTYMLTHWGRDRTRGPKLPLELLVKRQTSETAEFFGINDRGRLEPGKLADVNVIDFENLKLHMPEIVYDLPAGGRRFVQRADGYTMTIAKGQPLFEKGVHTGLMQGRLLRAGR